MPLPSAALLHPAPPSPTDTARGSVPTAPVAATDSAASAPHLLLQPPAPKAVEIYTDGFPLPKDSAFVHDQRVLWDSTARAITWRYEGQEFRPKGVAGDPVPYMFRNDDFVTSALLVSFLRMVWVVTNSWKYLRALIKDFFYHRLRPNLFTDRAHTELRGGGFLVFQAAFMQGILFFDYTQYDLPRVFGLVSPYLILGGSTLVIATYYLVKIGLYRWVNDTFFPSANNKLWDNHLQASILLTGCLSMPLALLVVYFNLPYRETLMSYILLLLFVKTLLIYKSYRIFFNNRIGGLHIILYFCALEIVPILLLWGALHYLSHQLVALS